MEFPRMLYRFPGVLRDAQPLQDGLYDTHIVHDVDALEIAVGDGWHVSPARAKAVPEAPLEADSALPPTRTELEQQATALGLKFDGRNSDRRLAEMVEAAMRVSS